MSKALLVMDMPKSCRECPLAQNESYPLEEAYMCSVTRKWVIDKECESRQNWCPLKEVPEKKEREFVEEDYNGGYSHGIVHGWNACIDEILKGSE